MKTTPARWYRDPPPQADGWQLHCLLVAIEPAMAAVVETFRGIIMAGLPEAPPAWGAPPDPLGDFLNDYAIATTGKPRRGMRPSPREIPGWESQYNQRPVPRRRSPYLRDRLAELPAFRDRDRPLPMRPLARISTKTSATLPQQDAHAYAAALANRGLPAFLVAWTPSGALEYTFDDSIPEGVIEIDGTRITLAEMRVACEGP